MIEALKEIALNCKKQLISRDLETNKNAVLVIKECLLNMKCDSFVKIILDLDIQQFLFNQLIKSTYSFNPNILKCLEQLCSVKIYFTRDYAVATAEILLKNLYNLVTDHKYENVVIESLKIITNIIENLDDYYSRKNLNFNSYLVTVRNLLTNKKDSLVICAVIQMFSALLLHKKFQEQIDDNILTNIEIIWGLSLQKLSDIFAVDARSSVIGTSKLCDSVLRMLTEIRKFKIEKIEKLYRSVQEISVNCLKFVCIPYICEFGLATNYIYLEYLCFLKTLLKTDLNKDVLVAISQKLVKDYNFTVITKYLDEIATLCSPEEQDNSRQLCLMILCEITLNLSDLTSCSYSKEKCKKYMFRNLRTIATFSVHEWLNLLKDVKINRDTKFEIIKFCTMYYVHSNNLSELQMEHFHSYVTFLKNLSSSIRIDIHFLRDLWLLFAVICCCFPEQMKNDFALCRATSTIEKLISAYEGSFDKVLIYHPSVVSWVFLNPFVRKQLIYAVVNRWLVRASTDTVARCAMLHAVSTWRRAAALLLDTLEQGAAPLAAAAAATLRAALAQGPLAHDRDFVQKLCVAVPYNIMRLGQEQVAKDRGLECLGNLDPTGLDIPNYILDLKTITYSSRVQTLMSNLNYKPKISNKLFCNTIVVTCLYMLHLSSYVRTPADQSLLVYSVRAFTSCVGSLGLSDVLPPVFYSKAFEHANTVLMVAKTNQISQVFMTFMNSEPMLYTLMTALISDNPELSVKASQLFNNLLEYQTYHRLYCRNTLVIKNDFLVKLMSVTNTEQLQLNLQILKTLLFKTAKSVLDLEIDENIIKGLYFRCLNLVSKPGDHKLSQIGLNCLEGLLKYSNFHNLASHDYLCHHTGNHIMILTYFDKETSRPIDRSFLSFIKCLLHFASRNKEIIYNKLSITSTFWKISLHQIADLILGDTVESRSDDVDLVDNILKQLFQFSDLLPRPLANYLRTIEENLT